MTVADRVRSVVLPVLRQRDLDLYDLEVAGPVLKVVVDRPAGVDLDALTDASRAVSRALDEADPIAGAYTLELSSPGLERRLRTPGHYAGAVGEAVKVKLTAAAGAARGGTRRLEGEVASADEAAVTVRTAEGDQTVAYDEIDRAHTVFTWAPAGKPGKGRRPAAAGSVTSTTSHEDKDGRR